jgi:predicted Zn finger-like uncharacterized protein
MILTCPECATSYFADDSAVGSGRMVRCAGCGASWRAEAAQTLELGAQAEVAARAEPAARERGPAGPPPADQLAEALPKAFRARAESERRTREAAAQGAIWAGLGAAFALLIGAGVVFRSDVVGLWPKAASAYASVGLPVNPVGLAIEDVHFQHALQDGHPALVVSGTLRNIRPRPVRAPPLQIVLFDKQGKTLLTRIAAADDPELAPGQSRSFAVSLLDPPIFASDLEVGFAPARSAPKLRSAPAEEAPGGREQGAAAAPARAMSLGTAIPEAKPLPSGSPYALRPAANGSGA